MLFGRRVVPRRTEPEEAHDGGDERPSKRQKLAEVVCNRFVFGHDSPRDRSTGEWGSFLIRPEHRDGCRVEAVLFRSNFQHTVFIRLLYIR